MASISSLGIGSGLDLNTLLAGMKTAEQAPLAALQNQQTSYTAKLSAYGQLNSALGALQSAAAELAKPSLFQGVTATSTASDVVTATALATATTGTYSLNVTQLSHAQSLATSGKADTSSNLGDAATSATLSTVKFEFGTTTGTSFAADATRSKSIDIDPAHSSLAEIAKKINDTTSLGVTASIVNDGSAAPFRLVLTSTLTGEASSMRITVSGDADHPAGDPALSGLLTNDPAGQKLEQTAAAQNTKLTVNGIAITSANNTVAGAVQDVTMSVTKLGTSTLSVQKDITSAGNAIATFVNAYNSLQSVAAKLTAFNATSKSGAVLLGDSTLRNIQVRIRSTLSAAQTPDSGGLANLTQVGIGFQKDGTLSFDATKLKAALDSQYSGVAKLFSGTAGVGGYGTQMSSLITSMTDNNGTLTAATKGLNTSLDLLGKQYIATSARIDTTVARYKAQFTQLDTLISSMNQTSAYLTQQFSTANSSK